MTDCKANYITDDYEQSTYYIIPKTAVDTVLHPCCQDLPVTHICPNVSANLNNIWVDWTRLVFDLRHHIGDTIRLRIIASECIYQAHYTYAYYTGYGLKGAIDVEACSVNRVYLQAPPGFQNHKWYVNNVRIAESDGLETLTRVRNTNETSFRCEVEYETGVPFIFNADVNYYNLFPNFEWEQVFDEGENQIQFTNTSEIYKINSGGNEPQPIQYVLWDFGDGNTSTAINPIHNYTTIGNYYVNLRIWDSDSICQVDTTMTITVDTNENGTPPTPIIALDFDRLISSSQIGNQWYNQDGMMANETNQELILTENGTYYVIVTQNNCPSNPSNSILVDNVSVQDYEQNQLLISPNPFTNLLTIQNLSSETYQYTMYNSIGQIVLKGTLETEVNLNTSNLPKGLYIIQFVNNLGEIYYKLVKQ